MILKYVSRRAFGLRIRLKKFFANLLSRVKIFSVYLQWIIFQTPIFIIQFYKFPKINFLCQRLQL